MSPAAIQLALKADDGSAVSGVVYAGWGEIEKIENEKITFLLVGQRGLLGSSPRRTEQSTY